MINAPSLNTSIASNAWARTPRLDKVSVPPIPAITRKVYQEHTVHSNEKVLHGEVLPRAGNRQQSSTQNFILERTLARARPIMTPGARPEPAQAFSQVNAYQSMENMSRSLSEGGNSRVDVYT